MEASDAHWTPIDDNEQHTTGSGIARSRVASVALVVALGLAGVGACVLLFPRPLLGSPARQSLDVFLAEGNHQEQVGLPTHLAQVKTVNGFNTFIQTHVVVDAKTLFDAMPLANVEALFMDFLATMGTEAPDASGSTRTPSSRYASDQEHEYRFGVFRKNALDILLQNAEEYAHNPINDRARFGLTVHADWTPEEFEYTRFNLRATNISAHREWVRQEAEYDPANSLDSSLVDSSHPEPVELGGQCGIVTGGTCLLFPCHAWRGAQCYEGMCVCISGSCAEAGKCIRPSNCQVSTGGSCHIFGCDASRGAVCDGGSCVCPQGTCAVSGKCVPQSPDNHVPSAHGITCSTRYTGPVRQQGQCGDCWAFSTAQQLRYMALKKYKQDPGMMSVQYLVDCMPSEQDKSCKEGVKGCCGGLPYLADRWLQSSGGLPTAAAYGPLVSDNHPGTRYPCKGGVPKKVVPVGLKVYRTEQAIANGFCANGPVSIAVNANTAMQHYMGGVFTVRSCPPAGINHAVLYTGVDREFAGGVHIILNSWGPNWGVSTKSPYTHSSLQSNGHILFKYGENVCNVVALATQPNTVDLV